jgi:hypothetical protein
MDEGEEDLVKKEFNRIKSEMHARMDNLMEQLSTYVNQQAGLIKKIRDLEATSAMNSASLILNNNDIKVIYEEVMALETFLAVKDPELKKIIDKNNKAIKKIAERSKNAPPRKRNN